MKTVKIYTTSVCPYCNAAKDLIKSLGFAYEEIRLDADLALREKLSAENNGWRTVPMIFVGSKFVGGFDDLIKLNAKGELVPLIQS